MSEKLSEKEAAAWAETVALIRRTLVRDRQARAGDGRLFTEVNLQFFPDDLDLLLAVHMELERLRAEVADLRAALEISQDGSVMVTDGAAILLERRKRQLARLVEVAQQKDVEIASLRGEVERLKGGQR